MNPVDVYKFCPLCAASLQKKEAFLLVCGGCGFHVYINPLPSAAAIIENDKREILLVKRKYPPMQGYWDFPGGFMHPKETVQQAVVRELQEELGVTISIRDTVGVYEDRYVYQNIENGTICVAVSGTIPEGAVLTPADDISEYAYMPRETILSVPLAFASIGVALNDYLALHP